MFKKRKANLLTNYLQETGEHILDDLNFVKKRRQKKFWHNFRLTIYTILIIVIFLGLNLLVFYPSLKNAYFSAIDGKSNLLQAGSALRQGQFSLAANLSTQAEDDWRAALISVKRFKYTPAGWLPYIRPKINDTQKLLETGLSLSQATIAIVEPGSSYLPLLFDNQTKFSELSSEHKQDLLNDLYASHDSLVRASNSLDIALTRVNSIQDQTWLAKYNIDLIGLQNDISYIKNLVDKAVPISKVLPALAGYPQPANYLFVLQNSDELRPTGGFIGTIGLGQMQNGEISQLSTQDVYHLDMPAINQLKVEPPEPIKQYLDVNYWYLRDANWSPDWPTSAKQIALFYQAENKLLPEPNQLDNFNFIIGITPNLITDLMSLTGNLAANGQTYTADNLVDLLQDNTGKDFASQGYSRWDRKAVISVLAQDLQTKLLDNLSNNWQDLFNILINNLDQKNILVYSYDYEIARLLEDYGWSGKLEQVNGDYLMVVDANLAALKTDAVMNKHINYEVEETDQGLIAKVMINYANHGQFTWKTTRYRSYTRIYVPKGSQLIKAAGFMGEEVVTEEELGKTYFGTFISIEPGTLANLYLEYKLPNSIEELVKLGKYNLLIQKQPGNNIKNLRVDLKFENPIQLYSPAVFYSYLLDDRRVRWETDLNNDKRFSINF